MKIDLTKIQYLHATALLDRIGYQRFIRSYPIQDIHFCEELGLSYTLTIEAQMSIDELVDFLVYLKGI